MLRIAVVLSFLCLNALAGELQVTVQSPSAILINAVTGRVIYEKNADERRNPASTTKIATAIYVLETVADHLQDEVEVDQDSIAWISAESKKISGYKQPAHWLEPGSTHMALKKGELLSLNDLLYGTMVVSADDASNVIAKYVGGSMGQYMERLNSYMKELGCRDTHYANPHGLYHPRHYTTARDLATITCHALKNDRFRQMVKTVRYLRPKTNKQEATTLLQSNKLLRSGRFYMPSAIGVKTGYIAAAGYCLVAAAEKDGRCLVAVLLGSRDPEDRYRDAIALFNTAFAEKSITQKLVRRGPQPFELAHPLADAPIATYSEEEFSLAQYPCEADALHCKLLWNEVALPFAAGTVVGEIAILDAADKEVARIPLKAQHAAKERPWYLFWRSWSPAQMIAGLALALFVAFAITIRRH